MKIVIYHLVKSHTMYVNREVYLYRTEYILIFLISIRNTINGLSFTFPRMHSWCCFRFIFLQFFLYLWNLYLYFLLLTFFIKCNQVRREIRQGKIYRVNWGIKPYHHITIFLYTLAIQWQLTSAMRLQGNITSPVRVGLSAH